MNKREQEIFMRGISVAFKAIEEWDNGLLESETISETKLKRFKKSKNVKIIWSNNDINILMDNRNLPIKELKKLFPDRSAGSIYQKIKYINKHGMPKEKAVKNNYKGLANLGQQIDR
jgi:hypothetical protein